MNDIQTYVNQNSALVQNPFGSSLEQKSPNYSSTQAASHELAEMQAQIYLAKQFPRNQMESTERILTACQRPGLANVAVYSYAKGGSDICGPSIRLAEEIARNWGNVECGWNEVERESDRSKVRAFAWDKETNVLKSLIFYVPHYRSSKRGTMRITDERDIYEHLANCASRRLRNCILALIPGDVVDAAVEQCQRTMATHIDLSKDSIKKLVDAFAPLGVSKTKIEKRIQRRIESITPAQFVRMREIYTSIKDGMSSAEDWFEQESVEQENASSNGAANKATEALKQTLIRNPEQTPEEPKPQSKSKSKANSFKEIAVEYEKRIVNCSSIDELKLITDEVISSNIPEDIKQSIYSLIDSRDIEFRHNKA